MGGKFHPRLNIGKRPIANKYREGKMKRTLKRELKVREIVKRETIETSIVGISRMDADQGLFIVYWCTCSAQVNISLICSTKPVEGNASAVL